MVWEERKRTRLLIGILLDAVLVNAGIILAFLIRFGVKIPAKNFSAYQELWVFVTIIVIIVLYSSGLYNRQRSYTTVNILDNTINGVTIGTLLLFVAVYATRSRAGKFPTTVLIISWIINIILISGWRIILTRFRKVTPKRALVVGEGEEAVSIVKNLKENPQFGYELIGVVSEIASPVGDAKVFKSIRELRQIATNNKVDEIIIALPPESHDEMVGIISKCQGLDVKFKIVPDLYEIFLSRTDGDEINGLPLVEVMTSPIYGANEVIKRIIDIVISSVALLLLFPLILLIMILVKIESKGPAFFKQERVGKDGKVFLLYKFRSMYQHAEKETGPILAEKNDQRVTKIGRILRRIRFDELPQLWNVLKGDMSLVGPRPERPFFVEKFKREIPGYVERLQVRPGITGLAQVHLTYDISPIDKLRYDLLYVRRYSIPLDLDIILRTIFVMLRRKGAQ